ncbi:alpha-1,6-mannosyltransferase Och1 [Ceratocystis pirilliformis]|uniref:Alpha-1,6-mannosyltransferase Och1 n=1 Tax=Ceratocystis pirilliformis TaxID=259994 RepID=A0ABR3ZPG4_9PEZI
MLSAKRALTGALIIIILFFLLTQTEDSAAIKSSSNSPTSQLSSASKAASSASTATNAKTNLGSKGKGSAGNIATDSQKPLMDTSKMTLREKLEYTYAYDIASKFPAYIWQTWKYTPADGEFEFREQEASWSLMHPGFIHEVITDAVAFPLIRLLYASTPEVIEAYKSLPLPVLRADFFRYLVLFARGGIYSDIDTRSLKSASEWVPKAMDRDSFGLVVGIEADPDRPDWHQWYSRRIQFCQWTIKAKPGHPVLREIIAHITEDTLKRKATGRLAHFDNKNVIEFTGPAIWTDIIMEYLNSPRYFKTSPNMPDPNVNWKNFTGMQSPRRIGDVVVLPITGFSPGVDQMGSKGVDDPTAMVSHEFEGTWKPEEERNIGKELSTEDQEAKAKPKAKSTVAERRSKRS